jgi:hypothetical protein
MKYSINGRNEGNTAMKPLCTQDLIALAIAGALSITSAYAQTTPDSVETRIGTMKFERGYPTEETARKLFDELDYQRAVQAYLWAYPAVSFDSIFRHANQSNFAP